ncbi:hypothetical protein G8F40_004354 [Salmonella enterica]|nr:hypothetical protein [Salmonella enterica subsp. enterica serovar Oranienburg]EFR7510802.1 hypothetical protein [Salmonella enterica]EEO7316495.1 hypothetical protein [Salmonella enterica subsp. enterica serovar Oranienburg]EEO7668926.1 hypothetical protein [Salmonella enterica subsp. enterica serovar Oranienburg]EFP3208805.1 hypothetical protein [Salmonella enterica subsp. enterica serovar Oranienburg]
MSAEIKPAQDYRAVLMAGGMPKDCADRLVAYLDDEVFPAVAGINRTPTRRASVSVSVPRGSGDKPPPVIQVQPHNVCSPR